MIESLKAAARDEMVAVMSSYTTDNISVFCVDEKTGELFEGLTDATVPV